MTSIDSYKIKFINLNNDGTIYKTAESKTGDPTIYHISACFEPEIIQSIITDVDHAINGNFSLVGNADISSETEIAFITPNNIEFWDIDESNQTPQFFSLLEYKELLIGWKNFLLSPPLHGSKI